MLAIMIKDIKTYDELRNEAGITSLMILQMDAHRLSINKIIEDCAEEYMTGTLLDIGAGRIQHKTLSK